MTMPLLDNLLAPGTIERLGWMLVHVLWQATAVAVLLAVLLRLLRNAGASVRYWIACSALALMVALPMVTLRLVRIPGPVAEAGPPPVSVALSPVTTAPSVQPTVEVVDEMPVLPQAPGPLRTAEQMTPVPLRERIVSTLEPALPCMVLGWLVGVFGLSAWHLGGWTQLQRLKRRMVREVGKPLQRRLEELTARLGVHRAVGLLESALVEVPTVVGWLRPVILLPASTLTGLSVQQLEAILAHELAHIRRHDYLVNIVQTVVEILGFYHPAIWWISRRIRIERENCCDDLAVYACGSSLQYARALACMEEIRHNGTELAVAATGGSLMARFAWLPGLVALLLVVGIILPAALVLGTPQPPQTVEPATVTADHGATEPNAASSNTESASGSSSAEPARILLDFKVIKVLDDLLPDRETAIVMANALGIESRFAREFLRPGRKIDMTLGEILKRYIVPEPLSEKAVDAIVSLLGSRGYMVVVSAPRLVICDGQQAKMRAGNKRFLAGSGPSAKLERIEYGTAMDITPRVLDAHRVNLDMMVEVSDLVPGPDVNQPVVLRTSAETSATALNDRYLVWAAVTPTATPTGQEADRRSLYIMVKPHINLPLRGLTAAANNQEPAGTPLRQVLLDVRTVTMERGGLQNLGIQWNWPTTKAGAFRGPSAGGLLTGRSGPVTVGYLPDPTFTNSLLAALEQFQKNRQATIARQQVIAQEGRPSRLKAITEEWFTVTVPAAGPSGQPRTEAHKTDAGTVLAITPQITDGNDILVEMSLEVSERVKTSKAPGGALPILTRRTAKNTITMKNGGTVAVAGLSGNEAGGGPGQETAIFVTAHLVQDGNEAPARAPQAPSPDVRVAPAMPLTPEQIASARREYVNSDPMVQEVARRIVKMERELIVAQQTRTSAHPDVATAQALLEILKKCLEEKRKQLEQEFDNGLTQRMAGRTGNTAERRQEATITATFANTDLRDVLAEIGQRTGVTITPDATVKPTPITAELVEASPETALRRVLEHTPYRFKKLDEHTYFVFRPLSFRFPQVELVQAIQDLSAAADVPIVTDPNVLGPVNARFENVSLEEALQILLAGKPYVFKRMPSYYLVAYARNRRIFPETTETRRIRLSRTSAARVKSLLSPVFAPYVQAEQPNPRDPNDQGNVLLVTASPALLDRIVADIKQIDHLKRQVLLDARVVSMEKGTLLNLGVEWSWPTIQAGTFASQGVANSGGTTASGWPYGVQIGYAPDQTFTNSLLRALNLLEENKQADIIANPKVMAQDGRRAEMKVIEEQWFLMTPSPTKDGSHTRTELQKIESGTVLTITPYIGDNNDIMLQMAVEVSDSIPKARGSDLPLVTRRLAKNTVTIKDGGTVAVAGVTGNDAERKDKPGRELAVFVTAHLVPDGRPGR